MVLALLLSPTRAPRENNVSPRVHYPCTDKPFLDPLPPGSGRPHMGQWPLSLPLTLQKYSVIMCKDRQLPTGRQASRFSWVVLPIGVPQALELAVDSTSRGGL